MFQDRRAYARRKETVTMRLVTAEGETQGVTTDIGPTGAFFAGVKSPRVDEEIDVLVRPVGVKIAPVRLRARVIRVVPAGGAYPPGFAVHWLWALSEVGSEPIFHVLRKVLHVVGVTPDDFAGGRRVRFDFPPIGGQFDFKPLVPTERREASLPRDGLIHEDVVAVSASRTSGVRHASSGSRPTLPVQTSVVKQPSTHLGLGAPRTPSSATAMPAPGLEAGPTVDHEVSVALSDRTPPSFATVLADGTPVVATPERSDVAIPPIEGHGVQRQRSGAWSTYRRTSDVASTARRTSDVVVADDIRGPKSLTARAKSDLSPTSRRGVSAHFDAERPSGMSGAFDAVDVRQAPGGRRSSRTATRASSAARAPAPSATGRTQTTGAFDAEDVLPGLKGTAPPRRADSGRLAAVSIDDLRRGADEAAKRRSGLNDSPFQERSQIFDRGSGLSVGGHEATGQHSAVHAPTELDLPVTYEYDGRFVPARMVSAAPLAIEVVTGDAAPALDDKLIVNMPIEVEGVWRTIYLHGRLLRLPEQRDDGHGFVLALESVQEGNHAGAFSRFLQEAQASLR